MRISGNMDLIRGSLAVVLSLSACRTEAADPPSESAAVAGPAPAASVESYSNAAIPVTTGTGVTVGIASPGEPVTIKVYKDANCGCCNKWVEHLTSNGFKVETMDMPDLSLLKQKHGVAEGLQSCHTAIVDGYVVEGHVPADVIRKMLKERPSIAGLAVPGMPIGSPGMEGATKEQYDVLTFDRAGRTSVYSQQ